MSRLWRASGRLHVRMWCIDTLQKLLRIRYHHWWEKSLALLNLRLSRDIIWAITSFRLELSLGAMRVRALFCIAWLRLIYKKAYDYISREFFREVLIDLDFHPCFTYWILMWVTCPMFRLTIIGELITSLRDVGVLGKGTRCLPLSSSFAWRFPS